MRSSRRSPPCAATRLALLVSVGLCMCGLVAPASGLEVAPTYENGPRTPFNPFGGVEERASTPPDGGLYVIGDSISWGVPYIQRAAADGARAQVRSWAGWTVMLHRLVTSWNDAPDASFDDAAAGTWGAVFVELGTNDIACLHGGSGCWENASDSPERLAAEQQKIAEQVQAAAATLLDAAKCVVWAGPRTGPGSNAADVATFNARLRDLERDHPGEFTYVDYDAYSRTDDALRADFARPDSDGVHPQTAAGRAAIAELAVTSAEQHCGLAADPPAAAPRPPVTSPPVTPAPVTTPPPAAPVEAPALVPAPAPAPEPALAAAPALRGDSTASARTRAALRCAASRSARARTACMLRVRRVYGPSRQEQAALRACARRARTRVAACRATVHRRYRAR
jgi:hypothetical protein